MLGTTFLHQGLRPGLGGQLQYRWLAHRIIMLLRSNHQPPRPPTSRIASFSRAIGWKTQNTCKNTCKGFRKGFPSRGIVRNELRSFWRGRCIAYRAEGSPHGPSVRSGERAAAPSRHWTAKKTRTLFAMFHVTTSTRSVLHPALTWYRLSACVRSCTILSGASVRPRRLTAKRCSVRTSHTAGAGCV